MSFFRCCEYGSTVKRRHCKKWGRRAISEIMTSPMHPEDAAPIGKAIVNILLVDDEVRNLEVLESILASPSYHLVRAQTAQEALMALIDGEFAVIVLDIQMPGT